MMIDTIIVLGGMGLFFGFILAVAAKKFHVPVDPRQEHLLKVLPGVNCGACGFPGCSGYAEALVNEGADPGLCTAGGEETARKIGEIMGREVSLREKQVARVTCGGEDSEKKFNYIGINECYAASLVAGGFKSCRYACMGLGDCVGVCPFDAILWEPGKIPEIIPEKCTACGKCIEACPVNVIHLIPEKAEVYVNCNSKDKGPAVRKICKTGCFTCRICVKFCPEKAITIEDNLAVIDYDKCTSCGICVKKCPSKTILFTKDKEETAVPATPIPDSDQDKSVAEVTTVIEEKDNNEQRNTQVRRGAGIEGVKKVEKHRKPRKERKRGSGLE